LAPAEDAAAEVDGTGAETADQMKAEGLNPCSFADVIMYMFDEVATLIVEALKVRTFDESQRPLSRDVVIASLFT